MSQVSQDEVQTVSKTVSDMFLSKVTASLHLILHPTKLLPFSEEQDIQTVKILGVDTKVSTHSPFGAVKIVGADGKSAQKVVGILRNGLLASIRAIHERVSTPILRLGSAKESEEAYKALSANIYAAVDDVLPNVGGMIKFPELSNTRNSDGSRNYAIKMFVYYPMVGALPEDAASSVLNIQNKLAKNVPGIQVTATVAVAFAEVNKLIGEHNNLLKDFQFDTTFSKQPIGLPNQRKDQHPIIGSLNRDMLNPMALFYKELIAAPVPASEPQEQQEASA